MQFDRAISAIIYVLYVPFQRPVSQGVIGIISLRIGQAVLSFLANLILARLLSVKEYGAYTVVLAYVSIITTVAIMGMNQLLIREVAAYHSHKSWSYLVGILEWSSQTVLTSSIFLCSLAIVAMSLFRTQFDPLVVSALNIAVFIVPIGALINLRQGTMQGLNSVVMSQLPEQLVQPFVFLLLLSSFFLLLYQALTLRHVVILRIVSVLVSFLLGNWLLKRSLPLNTREITACHQRIRWFRSCPPLFFMSIINLVQMEISVITINSISGTKAAAIFSISFMIASVILFITSAFSMQVAPKISALYAQGAYTELEKFLINNARANFLITTILVVIIVLFRYKILDMWGHEYANGAQFLIILLGSHVIYTMLGFPTVILTMTNHASDAARCNLIAILVHLLMCLALISNRGAEGAIWAIAASSLTRGFLMAGFVRYRLHIDFTILGKGLRLF